ncbi:ArgE/DapE family deacylase [Haladaptatus sp. ZSTT2]|uniref:ArgE/DapE family deacylase n=1 Tax=Haladaptatus sp. ZSTT2 TaxID=3120515 RepID=UPI00300E92B8
MTARLALESDLRQFVSRLLRFDTTAPNEKTAQQWVEDTLDSWGFETYTWTADAERLASHPSFPDDPAELDVAARPSVGGVLEFGDPDAGPTVVLNGHVDVVPAEGEWSSDPFEPTWNDEHLTARGAADMKSGLSACIFAARTLAERDTDLNGRVVVESVVGEEEGGIGAAAAALDNPYPFSRDMALIAEPTELRPVLAVEGSVMKRLELAGRSAHAARRWRGESVLPHFEAIRRAFEDLETERAERITHPLYERFENPWPTSFGTVHAGSWASTVPSELTAEVRIGVAPGETVAEVEAEYDERLAEVVAENEWLREHQPSFERFSIQFEAGEISEDEPIHQALQAAMAEAGLSNREPIGETYGADSRHYIEAGIPTVLFGPGTIDQAHFPDETIDFREVVTATSVIADTVSRLLQAE